MASKHPSCKRINNYLKHFGVLVVLTFSASFSVNAEEQAAKESSSVDDILDKFHGYLDVEVRARESNGDEDLDFIQRFVLNYGDLQRDPFSFTIHQRATFDTNDSHDSNGFFAFDSIQDTYNSSAQADLMYGYANFRDLGLVDLIRGGRQEIYGTPRRVYMDGALVNLKPFQNFWNLELGGYAGVPVHLREGNRKNDFVWGTYLIARPWDKGRIRMDYMNIKDEYGIQYSSNNGVQHENLHSYSLWQGLGDNIRLFGKVGFQDTRLDESLIRGTYQIPEHDFLFQVSLLNTYEVQRDTVLLNDPFFESERFYWDFWQLNLLLSKGFGNHFRIDAGLDIRELEDDSNEGTYNREFTRWFVSPSYSDFLYENLDLSFTVEYWDSSGTVVNDDSILTVGADLSYRHDDWRFSTGTYFSRYKYFEFIDTERDDVQTFYIKAKYDVNEQWQFRASFDFENDDREDYWQLKLGVTFTF